MAKAKAKKKSSIVEIRGYDEKLTIGKFIATSGKDYGCDQYYDIISAVLEDLFPVNKVITEANLLEIIEYVHEYDAESCNEFLDILTDYWPILVTFNKEYLTERLGMALNRCPSCSEGVLQINDECTIDDAVSDGICCTCHDCGLGVILHLDKYSFELDTE